MVKFKISLRTNKDLNDAVKLYNWCVSFGRWSYALCIAKKLHKFGYKGWDKKIDMILNKINSR